MLWFPFPLLPGADPLGMEGVGHSMAGGHSVAGALGMGGGRGKAAPCLSWQIPNQRNGAIAFRDGASRTGEQRSGSR